MIIELQQKLLENSEKTAVIDNEIEISYGKIAELSDKLAGALKNKGFNPGDRIILFLPNSHHFIVSYLAILKAQCVVVPINLLNDAKEIRKTINNAIIKGIIFWKGFEDKIKEATAGYDKELILISQGESQIAEGHELSSLIDNAMPIPINSSNPDDWAIIQYSGSSRKVSRGAAILYKNLKCGIESYQEVFKYNNDYRVIAVLPFFHPVSQIFSILLPLLNGSTIIVHSHFDEKILSESLNKNNVSVLVGVPSIFEAMMEYGEKTGFDYPALRFAITSGSCYPVDFMKKFEENFKIPLIECYGNTETFYIVSSNRIFGKKKLGSIGYQLNNIKMKITGEDGNELLPEKVGELYVKGNSICPGYVKEDGGIIEIESDGWFPTGDLAKVDYEGFYYLIDKKENVIIKGGFPVYSKDIKNVLLKHPDIKEAAVIGVKDDKLGQEIKAYITLKYSKRLSPQDIINHCSEHLEKYKCPKYIKFTANIPKGPTGKTLTWLMREWESR